MKKPSNKEKAIPQNSFIDEQYSGEVTEPTDHSEASLLLSNAKANWYFGEWQELAALDLNNLQNFPDVGLLAALKACGYLQLDDIENSKIYINIAKKFGCDQHLLNKLLIAGVHNTLGKLAALQNDKSKTLRHFNESVDLGKNNPNAKLARHARSVKEMARIGLLSEASTLIDEEIESISDWKVRDSNRDSRIEVIASELDYVKNLLAVKERSWQRLEGKDKYIVVVGTIPRSGSTWLFNACRIILQKKSMTLYSCWVEDYEPDNRADIHLVKIHSPDPGLVNLADAVFTTRRDIREVAASLVRMNWDGGEERLLKQVRHIVNQLHPFWHQQATLEIAYENISRSANVILEQLGHVLGVHLNNVEISKIKQTLETMENPMVYDKKTQLHPNHRAKTKYSYKKYLDKELLGKVNEISSEWLKLYGYF